MFGIEFYPSPRSVIEEMLNGINVENKIILEPSAGKGNIVDYLKESGAKDVIACESDRELRQILGTKCNIIENDFFDLDSTRISHINSIIMNPPFSCADKHILHAWNIAPSGCQIISLCNSETLKSRYSQSRRELDLLITENGHHINLGNCFAQAERYTGVEVSVIYLNKPGESYEQEFSGFFLGEDLPEQHANAVMPYNVIRDLVMRYITAIKLFDKQLELATQMNTLTDTFYKSKIAFTCSEAGKPKLRNEYKKELQKEAWKYVFNTMNMNRTATRGLSATINKFVEQQEKIPFTMRNVYRMIEIVIGTTSSRMDTALVEVFDNITKHHHENRYRVEGWKTNSHYLLNEKFIMEWVAEHGYNGGMRVRYGAAETINDFVKALCYISGNNYSEMTELSYFASNNNCEFGKWYSWGFFEIKGFKKGTMHFKFQNKDLWAKFNQNIARIKGFPLPESMKNRRA